MTTNMAMVHNMCSYKATCDLDIPDHRYPFEHCDVLLKMPILLQKQNLSLGVCVCVCVCVLYLPRYSFGRGGWCYTLACLWRICGHVNQHLCSTCITQPYLCPQVMCFYSKSVKLRFGLLLNLPLPFNVFPITRVRTQSNWSDYDTNTRSCRSTTYPWAE